MLINYDVEKINKALGDFHNATGANVSLLKTDFFPVSGYGENTPCYCMAVQKGKGGRIACLRSDASLLERCKETKKLQMHICHAGLVDVAVPLLYENVIIGYISVGRMKPADDRQPDFEHLEKLGLDIEEMKSLYSEIAPFDADKISSVCNIAIILAKYILLENMLKPSFGKNTERAVEYINENLEEGLTIKSIAENVNVSKSVLYKNFHTQFNCTVSEYINTKRVERSVELMQKGDMSIEEIAQKSGFSSAAYYSRIFKKKMGMTPTKYKKTLL